MSGEKIADSLSLEDARRVIDAAVAKAVEIGVPQDVAVVDTGGIPVVVDPVATGSLLGERQFRQFVLPYLVDLLAHIAGRGMINKIKEIAEEANILALDYDASAARVNQENRIKLMLATAK